MQEQLTLPAISDVDSYQSEAALHYRRAADKRIRRAGDRTVHTQRLRMAPSEHSLQHNPDADVPRIWIYTLGRFSLAIDGESVVYGRKAPQRPLELLKTLIALGSRGVSTESLVAELWPDVDGDTAKKSFDTTLYRLRKLIGDDGALVVNEGKVTINRNYCWVDVWEFDRLLGNIRRILKTDATGKCAIRLDRMGDRLFSLYQNHFLENESVSPVSVSFREKLRNKFIYHLLNIGHYWEVHGFWKKALYCYQKGLDVDDLIEIFYQRAMYCYQQIDRPSEGIVMYRRCCQILSVVMGIKPGGETERLYRELIAATSTRQVV